MSAAPMILALTGMAALGWAAMDLARAGSVRDPDEPSRRRPSDLITALGIEDRLRRAGRIRQVEPRRVLLTKAIAAAIGSTLGLSFAPLLSARLGPVLVAGLALGGFMTPDLMLERAARRRVRRMVAELPDTLDLLSVSVATGRTLGASLSELAAGGRGPLMEELAVTGEDLAWGSGQAEALADLKRRVPGKEIAALCASLERSRRLGSPLADLLRRQSSGLRQDRRREIEERAARAAPKIQLVIALVLVPSVLLIIVAGLIANSDALFEVGY